MDKLNELAREEAANFLRKWYNNDYCPDLLEKYGAIILPYLRRAYEEGFHDGQKARADNDSLVQPGLGKVVDSYASGGTEIPHPKRYIFEGREYQETGEVRPPQIDEVYLGMPYPNSELKPFRATFSWNKVKCPILRPVEPTQKTVTELSIEPVPGLGEMVFGPRKLNTAGLVERSPLSTTEIGKLKEEITASRAQTEKDSRVDSDTMKIEFSSAGVERPQTEINILSPDYYMGEKPPVEKARAISRDLDDLINGAIKYYGGTDGRTSEFLARAYELGRIAVLSQLAAKDKEIAELKAERRRLRRWRNRVYKKLSSYTQSLGLRLDIANIDWKEEVDD